MKLSLPLDAEIVAEVAVYQGDNAMLMAELELRGHSILTGPFQTWTALFHALGEAAGELDGRIRIGLGPEVP